MTNQRADLQGLRVFVVEDEFLIAADLEEMLQRLGCEVLGPVASIAASLQLLCTTTPDFAILDVNLGGQYSAPVAAALAERGVPFLFATGYSERDLPDARLRGAPRLSKPLGPHQLREGILRVLGETRGPNGARHDPSADSA